MHLSTAKELKPGDLVTPIRDCPGESQWNPDKRRWDYDTTKAGGSLIFQRLIPKVRIVKREPYQDSHDMMLFCKTQDDKRAWLNISNARRRI